MKRIASVSVFLDNEMPDYLAGRIRCGSVISEDEDGNEIKDHQELIDNTEFDTEEDLCIFIAQKLLVDPSIVCIQE